MMSTKDTDTETETTPEDNQALDSANEGANESEEVAADSAVAAKVEVEVNSTAAEDTAVAAAAPQKKGGNKVGWLALLLSLIAVAAAGYTVSRDWLAARDSSADDRVASLDGRIAALELSLPALDSRVAELGVPDAGMAAEIDALRADLDQRVGNLSSLPSRISSVESSVAALSGVSEASRATWLLAEAEYYLQIANAQLQLANNPELAEQALGMADERVMQISDPGLTDVRRAISNDRAALSVMDKPDIAGATLTLASLARVVESLPLAGADAGTGPADADAVSDAGDSGIQRAWSSMKGALSGLVRVTPPDQARLALISPDAEFFLRNNLALQLQSARLALLRGEQAVFEQTLDDTSALISEYFDRDSAPVTGALETLAEIRSTALATAVPDISGSLRLLRQYRTLSESAQ